MIRMAVQDLSAGRPVGSKMANKHKHEDDFGVRKRHGPGLDEEHYVHCFDYLMQVSWTIVFSSSYKHLLTTRRGSCALQTIP